MRVYLVGGAVRDELLGRPVSERDWVVVGTTAEEMQRLGFRPVGREFPVFLHPETKEEYALARLERKTAAGYRGFVTEFSPDVSLEQDLLRRDLTINAMARAADGTLIDPYGGRDDLSGRQLRHVSAAFIEDPVRVLRVARFAARFAGSGFQIAPETRALMQAMVVNGEVASLVPERVWREMERALGEANAEAFFDTLHDCDALRVVLPELHWGAADRDALQAAVRLTADASVRFAALMAATAAPAIEDLCERLRVPNPYRELAVLSARLKDGIAGAADIDAAGLLELLESADAFRRSERFERLVLACCARAIDPVALKLLQEAAVVVRGVALSSERMQGLQGVEIAAELRAARIARLKRFQSERRKS